MGTARRECLDHLLIAGHRHLKYVLKEFVEHYQEARPHRGLDQRTPSGQPHGSPEPPVPNPGSPWRNLIRSDMPLPARLRAFAVNTLLKVRTSQVCCGHYGEPGC